MASDRFAVLCNDCFPAGGAQELTVGMLGERTCDRCGESRYDVARRRPLVSLVYWAWLALLAVWLLAAEVTFRFHHPWMTETERFLYLGKALTFQRVAIDEVRAHEAKR